MATSEREGAVHCRLDQICMEEVTFYKVLAPPVSHNNVRVESKNAVLVNILVV